MTLTQIQAFDIATKAAIAKGIDLRLYKTPSVSTDASRHVWYIFFEMKGPFVPAGGWFGIEVDDATNAATLIPGA